MFKLYALSSSKTNDMFLANDAISFARMQRGLQPKRIALHKYARRTKDFHEDIFYSMKQISTRNEEDFKTKCANLNLADLSYHNHYKESLGRYLKFADDLKNMTCERKQTMLLLDFMITEAHWGTIYEVNGMKDASELAAFFICRSLDFSKEFPFYKVLNHRIQGIAGKNKITL
ncbi:hypothetical protein AVEN_231285-1 [Araneus ventricosus]|uniref:Uncharacterized protein n=1 Tax=Araneus ventricosus TaxID=182803 RepID=A0A4Y2CJ74_ARAVE|nr:hypothetical protein AVEN_231285-1 [Araneus ventricosus]